MGAADGHGRNPPLTGPRKAAVGVVVGFALVLVGMLYGLATGATELFGYLVVGNLLLALAALFLTAGYDSV